MNSINKFLFQVNNKGRRQMSLDDDNEDELNEQINFDNDENCSNNSNESDVDDGNDSGSEVDQTEVVAIYDDGAYIGCAIYTSADCTVTAFQVASHEPHRQALNAPSSPFQRTFRNRNKFSTHIKESTPFQMPILTRADIPSHLLWLVRYLETHYPLILLPHDENMPTTTSNVHFNSDHDISNSQEYHNYNNNNSNLNQDEMNAQHLPESFATMSVVNQVIHFIVNEVRYSSLSSCNMYTSAIPASSTETSPIVYLSRTTAFSASTALDRLTHMYPQTTMSELAARFDLSHLAMLAAMSALLYYTATLQCNIVNVVEKNPMCILYLDECTWQTLQLTRAEPHPCDYQGIGRSKEALSLFTVVNHTQSTLGRTLLKQWFATPSSSVSELSLRYATVEYFVQLDRRSVLQRLRRALHEVRPTSRLFRLLRCGQMTLRHYSSLHRIIRAICHVCYLIRDMAHEVELLQLIIHNVHVNELSAMAKLMEHAIAFLSIREEYHHQHIHHNQCDQDVHSKRRNVVPGITSNDEAPWYHDHDDKSEWANACHNESIKNNNKNKRNCSYRVHQYYESKETAPLLQFTRAMSNYSLQPENNNKCCVSKKNTYMNNPKVINGCGIGGGSSIHGCNTGANSTHITINSGVDPTGVLDELRVRFVELANSLHVIATEAFAELSPLLRQTLQLRCLYLPPHGYVLCTATTLVHEAGAQLIHERKCGLASHIAISKSSTPPSSSLPTRPNLIREHEANNTEYYKTNGEALDQSPAEAAATAPVHGREHMKCDGSSILSSSELWSPSSPLPLQQQESRNELSRDAACGVEYSKVTYRKDCYLRRRRRREGNDRVEYSNNFHGISTSNTISNNNNTEHNFFTNTEPCEDHDKQNCEQYQQHYGNRQTSFWQNGNVNHTIKSGEDVNAEHVNMMTIPTQDITSCPLTSPSPSASHSECLSYCSTQVGAGETSAAMSANIQNRTCNYINNESCSEEVDCANKILFDETNTHSNTTKTIFENKCARNPWQYVVQELECTYHWIFHHVDEPSGLTYFKTAKMTELDEYVGDLRRRIHMREEELRQELDAALLLRCFHLFAPNKLLAELDVLLCFAHNAITLQWHKPTLCSVPGKLSIVQGWHPILGTALASTGTLTPFSIDVSHFTHNKKCSCSGDNENRDDNTSNKCHMDFVVNTILPECHVNDSIAIIHDSASINVNVFVGANGSGKSVLLSAIAQIVFLAQIGSFVPALHLELSPVGSLYALSASSSTCSFSFSHMRLPHFDLQNKNNEESNINIEPYGRVDNNNSNECKQVDNSSNNTCVASSQPSSSRYTSSFYNECVHLNRILRSAETNDVVLQNVLESDEVQSFLATRVNKQHQSSTRVEELPIEYNEEECQQQKCTRDDHYDKDLDLLVADIPASCLDSLRSCCSLILLDEFGRGTSAEDARALLGATLRSYAENTICTWEMTSEEAFGDNKIEIESSDANWNRAIKLKFINKLKSLCRSTVLCATHFIEMFTEHDDFPFEQIRLFDMKCTPLYRSVENMCNGHYTNFLLSNNKINNNNNNNNTSDREIIRSISIGKDNRANAGVSSKTAPQAKIDASLTNASSNATDCNSLIHVIPTFTPHLITRTAGHYCEEFNAYRVHLLQSGPTLARQCGLAPELLTLWEQVLLTLDKGERKVSDLK